MTRPANVAATALGAVAAVGVAAFAWGSLIERNLFTVRRETLPLLEPGARDIRVLHLADLHMAPWQRKKQEWVRSLAALKPDLIINTGDNLGHHDAHDALEYALEPFAGVPGVFVNGSNDYFGPVLKNPFTYFANPSSHDDSSDVFDTARLEDFFTDTLGWLDLNNAAGGLTINGSSLEFFGVDDAHRNWDALGTLIGAIEEVREERQPADGEVGQETLSIGVTHAPYQRVLNSFVTNGAQLIFAGHTHGGQVRIPGLPALVTNCDIPRAQAQGVSLWRHARRTAFLNVSAGIGTSIYAPVRFACRPEAVLVTLSAGDFGYS